MKKRLLMGINFIVFILFISTKLFSQDSLRLVKLERSAEYPDGIAAMHQFIQKNLKRPNLSEKCPNGLVFVNFCVNID